MVVPLKRAPNNTCRGDLGQTGIQQYVSWWFKSNGHPARRVLVIQVKTGTQKYIGGDLGQTGPKQYICSDLGQTGTQQHIRGDLGQTGTQKYIHDNLGQTGTQQYMWGDLGQTGEQQKSTRSDLCKTDTYNAPIIIWLSRRIQSGGRIWGNIGKTKALHEFDRTHTHLSLIHIWRCRRGP